MFLNGNSWGAIVAVEYYKVHPEHVAGILFSGEAFDINAAEKEINKWVATLSKSAQQAFAQYNADKNIEAPAYKAATDEFYAKNVFRRPVKADHDSMFAMIGRVRRTRSDTHRAARQAHSGREVHHVQGRARVLQGGRQEVVGR